MSLAASLANRAYLAYAGPARRRFEKALREPARAQRERLEAILRRGADSDFGRAHGFARIRSIADFRRQVPIRDYDDLAADVARIAGGAPRVLTGSAVRCFEPTSGSSGGSKLVPYTAELLGEFSAATLPWIGDLLRHRPALRHGRAYWAVSPPARQTRQLENSLLPVGLEHDSDYFPAFVRRLFDRVLATPRALSRAPDVATCRYLTLRALLALPDLALVSVWNPSFLSLLASALDENFPRLLADLETGDLSVPLEPGLRAACQAALPARPRRAAELRRRFGERPPEDLGQLFDRLSLISCWTDGHAGRALAELRRRFPEVEIQGKGLLATEGVVSIPWLAATGAPTGTTGGKAGAVAAVTSHFLEFERGGQACGAHELELHSTYEVLLTTSGGFYRYRLKDLVRVEGFCQHTPILSFRGRADRTCDLAGEKLSPLFAERTLGDALAAQGVRAPFAMLAPSRGTPPSYRLFVECDPGAAEGLAAAVEQRLRLAHHYDLCRALGQLGPLRVVPVAGGAAAYEEVCLGRGQRAGAIKPAALDEHFGWEEVFAAAVPAGSGRMPAEIAR